jgi:pyrroloquinoline-quinone synthase
MKCVQVLDRLDGLVDSRSILGHPFYVAWHRGELSRAQLATYARVYYPHVAAFPGHLEEALGRATEPAVRDELARNLADELGRPAPHPELWLDFAEELGLDRDQVVADPPHPAAERMINTLRSRASGSTAGALAALYAYESQQPEVSDTKMEGLERYYDVSSQKGLAYFAVHATLDREHREGEREALGCCLDQGADVDEVLGAAEDALAAYWQLLDGVCEEAGVPMATQEVS